MEKTAQSGKLKMEEISLIEWNFSKKFCEEITTNDFLRMFQLHYVEDGHTSQLVTIHF